MKDPFSFVNTGSDTGKSADRVVGLVNKGDRIMRMNMKLIMFISLLLFAQLSFIKCEAQDEDASVEVEADGEEGDAGCGCAGTSRGKDNAGSSEPVLADAPQSDSSKPDDAEKKDVLVADAKSNYPRTNQMTYIPKGTYMMGSNNPIIIPDGEGPARRRHISGFWYDLYEVSNAEFELFVNSTGYVTEVGHLKYFLC